MSSSRGYREYLQSALQRRIAQNTRYSLRAFARDLKLSPSYLSQVLGRKRGLTEKNAAQVFARIGVPPTEARLLLLEVRREHLRSNDSRKLIDAQIRVARQSSRAKILANPELETMSDWFPVVILNLFSLKGAPVKDRSEFEAFAAKRLELPVIAVREALRTFEALKLIVRHGKGYRLLHTDIWMSGSDPAAQSRALRKFHRQMIEKALASQELQPVSERFFQTLQMPFRRSDLPALDREVLAFRNRILRKYGRMEEKDGDCVYALNLQFFRLDESLESERKT